VLEGLHTKEQRNKKRHLTATVWITRTDGSKKMSSG